MLAERLAQQMVAHGLLSPLLSTPITLVEKQRTFGKSRVDFVLHDDAGTYLDVLPV